MKDLIEALYLTNRVFLTDEYKDCLEYIDERYLDLDFHAFPSGRVIWDSWVVPQKWTVNEAYVEAGNERVIDFADHPLHLISYSEPFEGTIGREELLEHVHTHSTLESAIPWHFRQNYRPWDSEWGFCASQRLVDSLDRDEYYVNIDTEFEDDKMIVGEHHVEGDRKETVVLVAHLDHTGMANDDLAGVAVGCELMERLRAKEDLTYSYKFLIVQELLGSAAYLATHEEEADNFCYGIFLEMPGNDNRILLQRSFSGETRLDAIAEHVLDRTVEGGEAAPFRERIGNDETIFEAPGFEIPMISISRYPYPEYHTHLDDPEIVSEDRLEEYCSYVEGVIEVLDTDFVPYRRFDGLPSLANPKYNLYIDPNDIDAGANGDVHSFRNRFVRYLDGGHTAFEIANLFDLDFEFVREYLVNCEERNLIRSSYPPES